ncbi:TLR cluster3 member 6 [Biomphalaria glabrata]
MTQSTCLVLLISSYFVIYPASLFSLVFNTASSSQNRSNQGNVLVLNSLFKKESHPLTVYEFSQLSENAVQNKEKIDQQVQLSSGDICEVVNQTVLNCSSRNLTDVPGGEYSSITRLHLQNNRITNLKYKAFIHFLNLERLNLENNLLTTLSLNCFYGLTKLKMLTLRSNNLLLNNVTFHPDIFSPLIHLEKLIINKNVPQNSTDNDLFNYPDKALSKLRNLVVLEIDGLKNKSLGPGFLNMTSLTNLTLAGYLIGNCYMGTLNADTFINVPGLKYLDLSSCYITGTKIHDFAFSHLSKLEVLNLTHNEDIDIDNLQKVFKSLYNITSLKTLSMHLIVNRYSLGICLDADSINYFPRYLETFDAQENNLEAVDRRVIRKLSPSLRVLNLSGNKFVFGTYLQDLKYMVNLQELYLNGGSFTYSLPVAYPFQLRSGKYFSSSNCTLYMATDRSSFSPFTIELPPNLTRLEMNGAGLTYRLTALNVSDNNLKVLHLKNNNFPSLEGPINGLHSLVHLDLSQSSVKYIKTTFFDSFTSIRELNLSNNLLGEFFLSQSNETLVFSKLTNLEILDLSSNGIHLLHFDLFMDLPRLHHLNLAFNTLTTTFGVDITKLSKLMYLDLTKTGISKIPETARTFIDGLNISVFMGKCSISCECDNLDFLLWMVNSKAFDKTFKNYMCFYMDSSSRPITDGYKSTIEILRGKCTSHEMLFFMVGCGTLFLFFLLLFGIIYRFRWKLRYLYYAAYLHYKKSGGEGGAKFKYDAFVSYDHADEETIVIHVCNELEARGLKLCVHGRDFRAGDYIASNVVKAVCSSRKTLVVLTKNLMNSYWCKYELQMANMEAVHTGRQVLIFLLVENIPQGELGVELLYNIRNNTYIPYPTEPCDTAFWDALWNKLANDIRD